MGSNAYDNYLTRLYNLPLELLALNLNMLVAGHYVSTLAVRVSVRKHK